MCDGQPEAESTVGGVVAEALERSEDAGPLGGGYVRAVIDDVQFDVFADGHAEDVDRSPGWVGPVGVGEDVRDGPFEQAGVGVGEGKVVGYVDGDVGAGRVQYGGGDDFVEGDRSGVNAHRAGDGLSLVIDGPTVFAPDPRFLARLAAAAARTLQAERLAADAAAARELAEIDRLRAALLTAVGHDLRTPLAGIKAGVSSLREPDLALTDAQRGELLATVEESADRMDALVENLLAMSRLRAGGHGQRRCASRRRPHRGDHLRAVGAGVDDGGGVHAQAVAHVGEQAVQRAGRWGRR